jgi:hypothetical protein
MSDEEECAAKVLLDVEGTIEREREREGGIA